MPNWCSNYLRVNGPEALIKKFKEEARVDDKNALSFEKHVPMTGPEEGWYDEHCNKWGTKWDADETYLHEDAPTSLCYSFNTAWAPPCAWLQTVVALFPELTFEMTFEEPGAGFWGTASGSEGVYDEQEMEQEDYLLEYNDDFKECKEGIEKMSQEELIACFAGIQNFYEYITEEEDSSELEDPELPFQYEFQSLAKYIIESIEAKNLPLFLNVDWGSDYYNEMFKQRLSKGE